MPPVFTPLPIGTVGTIAKGTDLYDSPDVGGKQLRTTTEDVERNVLLKTSAGTWYGVVTKTDDRVLFVASKSVTNLHVPIPSTPPPDDPLTTLVDGLLTQLVQRLIPIVKAQGTE